MDRPKISSMHWCTQPRTTTTIFCQTSHCKHVRFKNQPPPPPSIAQPVAQPIFMPLLANVKVASFYQKRGFVTTPSVSTAASTASNRTVVNGADQDNLSLLARLQGSPIHAPPGPRPLCTGARVPTKTQMAADQKAERLVKKQAGEEKKLAVAARKVKREAKKKEKLISATKDKAAKALAKAEELRLKLTEAINGKGLGAAAGQELAHHPQKKSRGSTGQLVAGAVTLSHSYLSPQRKGMTAKKRVSMRSPHHFSHYRTNSLLSGSLSSGFLSAGVLTIGEDSDDDKEGAASNGGILQGNQAEPCRGCQYAAPLSPEPQRWRRINCSSSGKDSASSSLDEGDSISSWGSRGGKGSRGNDKSRSHGNGDLSSGTDKVGSDLSKDKGKYEILEGIWLALTTLTSSLGLSPLIFQVIGQRIFPLHTGWMRGL